MTYSMDIAYSAKQDIFNIKKFVESFGTPAENRIQSIVHTIKCLATLPFSGTYIPELEAIGITDIRRKSSSKDHIVYKIDEANEKITVFIVYPHKNDFQTKLLERILRP